MKIIEEYIELKIKYNSYFQNYKPKERVKYVTEIQSLLKLLDELEGKIINGIITYSYDYEKCYNDLKSSGVQHFLTDSVQISRFLMSNSIKSKMGFDETKRLKELNQFKSLCEKAWEDFIISKEERDELNEFCVKHFIDKTQQFLIEQEVSRKYNDNFDLIKIVRHYYLNENLSEDEIQKILKKEYKRDVEINRIKFISTQLNEELNSESKESQLIKTLNWDGGYLIYVIKIMGELTSGYEFEIGYKEGEKNSFKIMITHELYSNSDRTRIIDVITDGICYYLSSRNGEEFQLKWFLEMKSNIRNHVESLY